MTDNSRSNKKKITIRASPAGVEKAEKALIRLGLDSKTNFAKSRLLSRSTVTKFFTCKPIQVDTFKTICSELQLNWLEVTEISGEETHQGLEKSDCRRLESNEETKGGQPMQVLKRQVTVLEKESQQTKAVITLEGDINSPPNLAILALTLKTYSGHTIKIIDIQEGSIKITVEGSPEDIEKLLSNFQAGEIQELEGFPVEDIQVLSESSEDEENNDKSDKWRLVREIVNQGARHRNLRYADLSDADLSGADLSGAFLLYSDLSDANLSLANLSDANLSYADLYDSDLSDANLSRANLSNANLSYADLYDSDLSDANLSNANLSSANLNDADLSDANLSRANLNGVRINEQTKIDKKWRLVWEIVNQEARHRNLSSANLSSANLSSANLSSVNLSSANLSSTNLIGADLSDANLIDADLRFTNLNGARINEQTKIDKKWRLVWEIVNQGAGNRNLSNADLIKANLSDANLIFANLSDANLIFANLRSANLRFANLRFANLIRANMSDADLRFTNLSGANLIGANLIGANLIGADVNKARFKDNSGLTEEMKLDLKRRGAIFEDSPGDRSEVLSRR
ncbi:MAG: pentapeptide repeat-containing protein [Symploca sp. SIO3E6]|nr:pentapeptide repeat-containing protein [Caldora sp. SIO3E6]